MLLNSIHGMRWSPLFTLNLVQLTIQYLFSHLTVLGALLFAWDPVLKMTLTHMRKFSIWSEKAQSIDAKFVVSASKLSDLRMNSTNSKITTQ